MDVEASRSREKNLEGKEMPEEYVDFYKENLPFYEGKKVKVVARVAKEADVEPGQEAKDYNLVTYLGVVQKPSIITWPPNNANGVLCMHIETLDSARKQYAIALASIEEVDDEIEKNTKEVSMSALQK